MNDIISIEYNRMKQVANQFEIQSNFVKELTNQLRNQMQVLQNGAWICDAATNYYGTMNDDVFQGLARLQGALNFANETCEKLSNRMSSAEDEAGQCIPNA